MKRILHLSVLASVVLLGGTAFAGTSLGLHLAMWADEAKPIVYSAISYTNLKGATHGNPSLYAEGRVLAFSAPTSVPGYTFTGWDPARISAEMTGAQTVRATWRPNGYQIVYSVNGGEGTMEATDCLYDAEGLIAANGFTRKGYEFLGWAEEADGPVVYVPGQKVMNLAEADGDVVRLYAVWRYVPFAISDIRIFSDSPWRDVALGYTVAGTAKATWQLSVEMRDHQTGRTYACRTLDGASLEPGRHVMIWRAQADGVKIRSSNAVFTVKVAEARYCVIDLSGGASATNYPVAYLSVPPVGGFNADEFKTTKLVLRRLEAGTFTMGDKNDSMMPLRTVTLTKPFFMGVFEMTQKQYALVMGENPSSYLGDDRPVENVDYATIRGNGLGSQWPSSTEVDAASFLGRLRARTGLDFDLPTDAQWEYACRAGTTSAYNNGGSSTSDLRQLGRYSDNKSDGRGGYSQHTTVGSYLPNAWGLYDLHGNVLEWCLDWYGNFLEEQDPAGATSGSARVTRGGAWGLAARYCTSTGRGSAAPTTSNSSYGFRLVCPLAE